MSASRRRADVERAALALGLALLTGGTAAGQPLGYRLPARSLEVRALDVQTVVKPPTRPGVDPHSGERWLAQDKLVHAAGSFLFVLAAQYVLTEKAGLSEGAALPLAAGVTLGIGLAREVHDGRRAVAPHFCVRDLVADAAGVGLGAALVAW